MLAETFGSVGFHYRIHMKICELTWWVMRARALLSASAKSSDSEIRSGSSMYHSLEFSSQLSTGCG